MLYLYQRILEEGYDFKGQGFEFGKEKNGIVPITKLPPKWRVVGNSLFDYIIDNKNRIRGKLEDDYCLILSNRYDIGYNVISSSEPFAIDIVVLDMAENIAIKSFGPYTPDADYKERQECLCSKAIDFLNEYYPKWEDPFAYWDEYYGGRFREV